MNENVCWITFVYYRFGQFKKDSQNARFVALVNLRKSRKFCTLYYQYRSLNSIVYYMLVILNKNLQADVQQICGKESFKD